MNNPPHSTGSSHPPRQSELNRATCALCELELPRHPVNWREEETEKLFCCLGCKRVFEILSDSALIEGDFRNSELYRQAVRLGIIGNPAAESRQPQQTPPKKELEKAKVLSLHISGMWCAACSWLIEKVVGARDGVVHSQVNFATDSAKIYYRPEKLSAGSIISAIDSLGYKALHRHRMPDEYSAHKKALLLRLGIALFLMLNVMMFSYVLYVGYFQPLAVQMHKLAPIILLVFSTPAVLWCGYPIYRKGVQSIRSGVPTMEILFSLSIISAFCYSIYAIIMGYNHFYFDTSVSLVALLLLGKFIETSAKQTASKGINSLYRMLPQKVRLKSAAKTRLVSVELLQPGDRFIVRPGEKVAADGIVVSGRTTVDESLLSGESRPVEKYPGSTVTGSAINLTGVIEVEALRVGEQAELAKIIALVESALHKKTSLERLVDKISRVFIPFVIVLALSAATHLLFHGAGFEHALLRAITILVIACPCALGLATPLAIAAGINLATSRGILVREINALSKAKRIDTVVFDKTGTLTEGKFTLLELGCPVADADSEQMLGLLGSLERNANHPLGEAVVSVCRQQNLRMYETQNVEFAEGRGIACEVLAEVKRKVVAGNLEFIRACGFELAPADLTQAQAAASLGRTVVFWAVEGWPRAGYLVFGDRLKPDARETVERFKNEGIAVVLLSGDADRTTGALARQAGIDDYAAGLLPGDKLSAIIKLQQSGRQVAMVGDGVNDAPAIAQADVGIALGRGTEIALESSAIVILSDELIPVCEMIDISRGTLRTIAQNLIWASVYNIAGLAVAVAGYLNPLMAALAMLASSLSVVGNSLRLSRHKPVLQSGQQPSESD